VLIVHLQLLLLQHELEKFGIAFRSQPSPWLKPLVSLLSFVFHPPFFAFLWEQETPTTHAHISCNTPHVPVLHSATKGNHMLHILSNPHARLSFFLHFLQLRRRPRPAFSGVGPAFRSFEEMISAMANFSGCAHRRVTSTYEGLYIARICPWVGDTEWCQQAVVFSNNSLSAISCCIRKSLTIAKSKVHVNRFLQKEYFSLTALILLHN
jgi:hypothetical protein